MDFTSINKPTYIWGEPTFDSLFYCAIIGKDRVLRETDINEKSKYIKSIIIKNNGGSISSGTLQFSHGLNSIIGNSGSGKTLLLNLIKFKLTEEKLNFAVSSSDSNYDSMYDKVDFMIIDNNGNPVKPKDINVFEGENLYSQIITTIKYNKDQLLKNLNATPKFDKTESLIANFNKELNRYITNRINIINSKSSIDDLLIKVFASIDYLSKNSSVPGSIEYLIDSKISTNLQEYDLSKKNIDIDLQSTKKAFDYLNQMFAKYGLASNIDKMSAIRFELFKQILLNRNSLYTQSIIKNAELIIKTKISEVVSEYNNNIGQRTKLVYQSKQIVSDETEKIIATLKKITLLNEELDLPYLDEKSIIDSVTRNDEIIKLANFEINKDILYDDLTEYFDSSIGSGNNKVLKSEFAVSKSKNESLYPINLFSKDSVRLFAEIFVKNNYTNSNIFRLNPGKFIKFDIMIRNLDDEYQQISSLSAGQLSKIYINMLIDNKLKAMENNAIILYDQPDNNLEKAFIYDTLGRKLADLKKRYQVIITTHEPLLVVNSDSNSIIRADNDPVAGVSKIKYENLSMYDVGDKKAAIDKIAKLIDGSHDAIKKRNQLYGGFDI
jgi:ABC-type lipoprotein export system ATPase subunit